MSLLGTLNRRFHLRYRLEYLLGVFFIYGIRALSPRFAWRSARSLARLFYRLGLRRKTMLANLKVAFPELSDREREDLARRCWEHFASVLVDVVFQRRMLSPRNVLKKIRFVEWAQEYMELFGVAGLRRRAHHVLFMTAHLGNWELGSGLFGLLGVNVVPVYRSLRNPWMDKLLRSIRLDVQGGVIERRGAVQVMLETLESGGNVGFLFDQEAVHGIYVPFFGQNACTHKTPAVLARDHTVKIFFGCVIREGDGLDYEARGKLLDLTIRTEDKHKDLYDITKNLMERLEAEIRRRPEQYFWMHRRWKRTGVHGKEYVPEKARR